MHSKSMKELQWSCEKRNSITTDPTETPLVEICIHDIYN